jgi:hypothetical protein
MTFTIRNHYVPVWYQRRFFEPGAGQTTFFYLDMKPDSIRLPGGRFKLKKSMYIQGPLKCFKEDHLYTLLFGTYASDVIEKSFFGRIDAIGEKAVPFFANYGMRDGVHEAFNGMMNYVAAQLFRTPKGLRLLRVLAGTSDHQKTLMVMGQVWQMYQTIWSEGVSEVFNCHNSRTKFIISDSPVTTYNCQVFPGSPEVTKYGMALIERIGTRTLLPLDREHCLCITNLQYVRNPKVNPLKTRENPRYFGQGLVDLRKVQRGREIEEEEVIAINHVLKTQATRYVAAATEEWLYPERQLKQKFWSKLGGRYFLHPDPRKVSFSTAIIAGGGSGPPLGTNEYGHFNLDNPRAVALREVEWKTFQAAKAAWDERDRRAGREPPPFDPDYV